MLRKIAEIKVPKGAGPREAKTKHIFATYDRQGAAFAFYFSDSNIAGAMANLLFMIDGQKVFVDDGVTLGETNETHTFTYPLPDKLLNYTGKVDGYLYFDFEDGSHSDEIHFVFTIKKSQIDETMEDAPDVYIKSFEEIKADVQSKASEATSDIKSRVDAVENAKNSTVGDIEKAKDDAESQIGDYVGEVESAKQDISSSASDVQSKASEANEDIDDLVKSTENARDEAVKTMNKIDYSNRNLLTGTSDEWKQYTFTGWQPSNIAQIKAEDEIVKSGDVVTFSLELDNTLDNANVGIRGQMNMFDNKENKYQTFTEFVKSGEISKEKVTATIPDNFKKLDITTVSKEDTKTEKTAAVRCHKLQKGVFATGWNPAPEDIVLKSELEKIKQAIINLGGSI